MASNYTQLNSEVNAKRRLELEASDLQDLPDGPTKAKKPMASLTHTGGRPPPPIPIAPNLLSERTRCDTSLGLLTQKFAEMLSRSVDGVLDLNVVSQELNVPKRRVYDVTNVLEGIKLIKKKSKSNIQWMGAKADPREDRELQGLIEEEKKLDELIQSCTRQVQQLCEDQHCQRYAYLTYEDVNRIPSLKEQTVIVIKAPAETKLEVPHPEESLQVYLSSIQGPIEVFVCSDEPVPMETTDSPAASGANGSHLNSTVIGKDSVLPLPLPSFIQVSSKDASNNTCGLNSFSNLLSELTQHSPPVTSTPGSLTSTPLTPVQPPSEDQHSFVTLTPPLAFSLDGEEYLLSLAEDEGITDLFSSVDLDQSPLDISPL
ncbi:transcription factor E2F3 [Embiotoca jacksoni]|uniref:transcription factor E2F3 n=1 Tax=Embiotoca jacksoni TaxID=100190 RepID=UPI00370495CA